MSANPLLQAYDLPPFSSFRPEHVKPAIERILAETIQDPVGPEFMAPQPQRLIGRPGRQRPWPLA